MNIDVLGRIRPSVGGEGSPHSLDVQKSHHRVAARDVAFK